MAGLEGTTVGPYEVIALLGRGGMGQVYRARDPRLEREVAIKVLADALSKEPGYLERFRREARAVAKLNHPNIVPVYDFGEQGNLTYLVMPLIPGGTLRDYLAQRRRLPLAEALAILEQVASALQYAHERGLVHRDVKPANILMSAEGRALLSDFGIVRLVEKGDSSATLTRMGAFVGSPEYAAPEMVTGAPVDQRVDLYALGVVLFQMLTGQLPFAAPTPVALLMMQTQQQPPTPRSLNPEIPPAVEAVLLKALAKKPEDRYQTAAALVTDLRAAAAAPSAETDLAQTPSGMMSDLPTVATYRMPQAPGSGPAGWANQGSGPAASPPLPQTYMTGLAALPNQSTNPPTPLPSSAPPRRSRRMTSLLLVVLAFVLVAGGGATLALAASIGLFKGNTTQTSASQTSSGVTPPARPSPTPTPLPTVYYMAHFYTVMNGDLENGDTVDKVITIGNNTYEAREGTNGDVYQNGSADMLGRAAGIAQVVRDGNGTPIFVVLVDRIDTYQDAHTYFQRQVGLIQSQPAPQSVGAEAEAGIVQVNGQQTYQLFVRDVNIIITVATVPMDAAQNMSDYFVNIARAIMGRGHECTYSTDGKMTLLPGNPPACQ
ncbi:MAG TPA: protein kinase [Ktedonobacterales bacterium]|nr:protein kinase [Ktedonobacterales bacterium]